MYEYITAGLILRSRANWYEYGGKSSKYFLNLEKRNKAKSHVRTLVSDSGIEINDPSEILSCMRDFYSNLYKRRGMKTDKECLQYLYDLNLPQLSDQDRNSCEGLLTKKECWDSLNAMKNGKSPGNDRLSKEFYVCFFNELSDSLIMALNTSFEVGQLSTSQRQAIITLIEKKDKDKRLIKNWRPISLINVRPKLPQKRSLFG